MLLDNLDNDCELLLDASSGHAVTAGEIRDRATQLGEMPRGLVFLMADGTAEAASWFLALLEARRPVALVDPGNEWPTTTALIDCYRPDKVIDPTGQYLAEFAISPQGSRGRLVGPSVWLATEFGPEPHKDLAVLLTTSGSTGSPKFVRLSSANIRANAGQIVDSLGIRADDRGVTVLPLFYSFGMSVLTSHALAGSSVLVTKGSVLDESFWFDMVRHEVTFLPGVPTTYAMLKRLGFDARNLPKLRALTQAGGRLAPELVGFFHDVMVRRGGQFFVMYGQTEASPRIACLPPDRLPDKLGSVGLALAGGELSIRDQCGAEVAAGAVGEILYQGPNVMMGYAESRDDLALGATQEGVLATGDLGYLDDEGFLFLTGRSKRISKLSGSRVSLDEVETMATGILRGESQVAVVDHDGESVSLFATALDAPSAANLRLELSRMLRVPPKLIDVRGVDALPLMPNGKPDYAALTRSLGRGAELR